MCGAVKYKNDVYMELNKDFLRNQFSSEYKKYYYTEVFEREGFERKKCAKCGKNFWTADPERELCGDPEHEPYSFISTNPKEFDYVRFWEIFSGFFKKEGHEIVERYPVVSRWRQDLYFTIASIQDFQRIENGKMFFEYNANPLLVPQMCMRFNDVPNVGISGRHFTSFMMAGQHAFNYPKKGYWRDRTIGLNFDFLTNYLKVDKKNLTYIEDVWAMGDFSEFGPCLESFSNGLELVNSVFTEFEYSNGKINELEGKVVDVGWGFERLLWFYTKDETAYDAVFRNVLSYIYKNNGIKPDKNLYRKVAEVSGNVDIGELKNMEEYDKEIMNRTGIDKNNYYNTIKPMQAVYAIADHSKTLLFGIADGALPSNVGGGYNLRIILRRMFDLIDRYGLNIDIIKLMEMHADELKGLYNGLSDGIDEAQRIIELEMKRYKNTKAAALSTVNSILKNNEELDSKKLKLLYESKGITPEYISKIANDRGVIFDVPDNFYSDIVKSDFAEAKKKMAKGVGINIENLPKTEKLFYSFENSSNSRVLRVMDREVILDKSPFYAESGGQEADSGTINGIKVMDVQSINEVIVHVLEKKPDFGEGDNVVCKVDEKRRLRLMAHHTATHLVSAAARSVLGKHAWQEGAAKGPDKAHIDISHYEKLSENDVKNIEDAANSFIFNGIKVKMSEIDRGTAEKEFGFSIYQGHGVPAGMLRIVEIRDMGGKLIDAEACGGLHLMNREASIGLIKIISTSRIHDGIDRIEFVAGPAAFDYLRNMENRIKELAKISGSDIDKLDATVAKQLDELREEKRKRKEAEEALSNFAAVEVLEEFGKDAKEKEVIKQLDYDSGMLRKIATHITNKRNEIAVMLFNKEGDVVCISGNSSGISAIEFTKEHTKNMKKEFVGGGSKKMAEGKIV